MLETVEQTAMEQQGTAEEDQRPTIEDLLVALPSEVFVLTESMPLIKKKTSFAAYLIYAMILEFSRSKNKPPSVRIISKAMRKLLDRNVFQTSYRVNSKPTSLTNVRYSDKTEKYQLAALVALNYIGDSGNSLYAMFRGSYNAHSDPDTCLRNWASVINMLKRARYIRPSRGPIRKRKYLSQYSIFETIDLPYTTIRRKLDGLVDQGYIGKTNRCGELGAFSESSVEYLRGSNSSIDKSILAFLKSQGLPPKEGNIRGYLIRRDEILKFLVNKGCNSGSAGARLSTLRKLGHYRKAYSSGHKEIFLTFKGDYFVKNFLDELSKIVNGKDEELRDQMYGLFEQKKDIRKAVTACVDAYANANSKIKSS